MFPDSRGMAMKEQKAPVQGQGCSGQHHPSPTPSPAKPDSFPPLSLHTRRRRSIPYLGTGWEAFPLHQEFESRPPEHLFSVSPENLPTTTKVSSTHTLSPPARSSHPQSLLPIFLLGSSHPPVLHLWLSSTVHKSVFLLLPPHSTQFDSLASLFLSLACLLPPGTQPAVVRESPLKPWSKEGDSTHAVCSKIYKTRNWKTEPLKISVSKHAKIDNFRNYS